MFRRNYALSEGLKVFYLEKSRKESSEKMCYFQQWFGADLLAAIESILTTTVTIWIRNLSAEGERQLNGMVPTPSKKKSLG